MFTKNHKLQVNETHSQWKGDEVKYRALHQWVRKNKPKEQYCEHCKQEKILELANKGEYNRNFDNYVWLCRSCHLKMDRKNSNTRFGRKPLTEAQKEESEQRRKEYKKRYRQNPENKEKIQKYQKEYRQKKKEMGEDGKNNI